MKPITRIALLAALGLSVDPSAAAEFTADRHATCQDIADRLPEGVDLVRLYRANRKRILSGDVIEVEDNGAVRLGFNLPSPGTPPAPPKLQTKSFLNSGGTSGGGGFLSSLIQMVVGFLFGGQGGANIPQPLGSFNTASLTSPSSPAPGTGIPPNSPGGLFGVSSNSTASPANGKASGCSWQSHLPLAKGSYNYGSKFKDPGRSRPGYDHEGVDLMSPSGTAIFAAGDGVVSKVGYSESGYGHNLYIKHGCGFSTVYAHLRSAPQNRQGQPIKVGDQVKGGDVVGLVGKTGNAKTTDPHLHFEVRHPQHASTKHGATNPDDYFSL